MQAKLVKPLPLSQIVLKMPVPALPPENHLNDLKKLAQKLEIACGDIFIWPSPGYAGTAIVALLNLAQRGLRPSTLKGGGDTLLAMLSAHFFADQDQHQLRNDDTAFAAQCCNFLLPLKDLTQSQCQSLFKAITTVIAAQKKRGKESLMAIAADGLAVGWAHEYLSEKQSDDILVKTQFFTPNWIAAYLCAETIGEKDEFCLLDPACGAGHLLVQAMRKALENTPKQLLRQRMAILLQQSLYGLDVDDRPAQPGSVLDYIYALVIYWARLRNI